MGATICWTKEIYAPIGLRHLDGSMHRIPGTGREKLNLGFLTYLYQLPMPVKTYGENL